MRVWSRTASMSELRHRLRVRRSSPSPERTIKARASGVKVLWPKAGPIQLAEDELFRSFQAPNAAARPSR